MFSPEDLDVVCKWWLSVCVVCKDVEILFFALIPGKATLFDFAVWGFHQIKVACF